MRIAFTSTAITLLLTMSPALVAQQDQQQYTPTTHGIRTTPALARAFCGLYLRDLLARDMDISEPQRERMLDDMTRASMQIAHKYQQQGRDFFEFTFEAMIRTNGRIAKEEGLASDFSQHAKPMVPVFREFLEGAHRAGRTHLDAKQLATFEQRIEKQQRWIDQFGERMDRWAEGDVRGNEEPFDDPPQPDEADNGQESEHRNLRGARVRARGELRRLGPDEWRDFVEQTIITFRFDEAQSDEAHHLLDEAARQAREVMTQEWQDQAYEVRRLYWLLQMTEEPPAPYMYQLDRKYQSMREPLDQIQERLRADICALVTDEQRDAVQADLAEHARKHGADHYPDVAALLSAEIRAAGNRELDEAAPPSEETPQE